MSNVHEVVENMKREMVLLAANDHSQLLTYSRDHVMSHIVDGACASVSSGEAEIAVSYVAEYIAKDLGLEEVYEKAVENYMS